MTPTHHTPTTSGATRSLVAPHMAVTGTYRDMLAQDVALAHQMLRSREADLEDALVTWRHCRSEWRPTHRRIAGVCVQRVRAAREAARLAVRRLAGWRLGREAA